MTVKELIEKLKNFDPEQIILSGHKGDNPHTDYYEVIDAYEIRGANNEEYNHVVIETD